MMGLIAQRLLILPVLAIAVISVANAQVSPSDRARAYYTEARTAFEKNEYDRTLSRLDEAIDALGKSNARIAALQVRVHMARKDFAKARQAIDDFYSYDAASSLVNEMGPFLIQIEEEEARLAAIAAEEAEQARIDRLADLEQQDKRSLMVNATLPTINRLFETTGATGKPGQNGRQLEKMNHPNDGADGEGGKEGGDGADGGDIHLVISEVKTYDYSGPVGKIEQLGPDGKLIPFTGILAETREPYIDDMPSFQLADIRTTSDAYGRKTAYVPGLSFDSVQHDFERGLVLNTSGAAGGRGGNGLDGTRGRNGYRDTGRNKNGGSGGRGGRGGWGGKGGDAGNIKIEIYGSDEFVAQVRQALNVKAEGGKGGEGGRGGKGARGGEGFTFQTAFARHSGSDGYDGKDGDDGRRGDAGRNGTVTIQDFPMAQYRSAAGSTDELVQSGTPSNDATLSTSLATDVSFLRPPVVQFPAEAVRRGIEGSCDAEFLVSETGRLMNIEPNCTDSVFDDAVTTALRRADVAPALDDAGEPTRSAFSYPFRFQLN